MKKTSSDLPLWARILFETPELVGEKIIEFRIRILSRFTRRISN